MTDVTEMIQFLNGLLESSEYNPEVVKWSHQKWREFQIMNADTVASLWGFHVNVPLLDADQMKKDIK